MRYLSIAFGIALLCYSTSSWALGKLGHRLVCQLAYKQLTSSEQQKIDKLLRAMPSLDLKRVKEYNHRNKNSKLTFAESCTWADVVKRDNKYKKFKPWHFINVAREQTQITAPICEENCITFAISYHANQLVKAQSDTDKLEALMFLGHWLGDIHQPLHVSFRSDLGGNKIRVTPFKGTCKNLHWYWDQCLLIPTHLASPQTNKAFMVLETLLLHQLTAKLPKVNQSNVSTTDTLDWANESLDLVRESRFRYCVVKEGKCLVNIKQPIVINEEYHQHYHEILQARIVIASSRLARLLKDLLS